jgi:hypothetical protein
MKRSRELPQAARLVLGLGALVIVGTALLMLPGSLPEVDHRIVEQGIHTPQA